jgi:hypothetical protein
MAKFRKELSLSKAEGRGLVEFNERWKSGLANIQWAAGFKLNDQETSDLRMALFIAVVEPIYLRFVVKNRKKPYAHWRDRVILTLRAIFVARGESVSLSYTDKAQTTIDTRFANTLRVAFELMPAHSAGQSSTALVSRARALRSQKSRFSSAIFLTRQREIASRMLVVARWRMDNEQLFLEWLKRDVSGDSAPELIEPPPGLFAPLPQGLVGPSKTADDFGPKRA